MPRIPRNPGSGKPTHNGPSNGPGSGSWATGTGGGPVYPRITPETAMVLMALRDDPAAKAARDEMAARMLNVLVEVAETDPSGAARTNAADKALDRVFGKALARAEVSGANGGALGFVIFGERESESADAWQKDHAPK